MGLIVGIDFNTYTAELVGLPTRGGGHPEAETIEYRKRKETGDDGALEAMKRLRTCFLSAKLYYDADVFFVERGFGASRKADFVLGCFFGLIIGVCSNQAPTNPMLAAEWKREISGACGIVTKTGKKGNGNLAKADVHPFVFDIADSQDHDLTGWNEDRVDAYAISTVGRWLNDRAMQT